MTDKNSAKGTAKVLFLKRIEEFVQKSWESAHMFESTPDFSNEKNKYFVTFPYPYMNGVLHLGHGFSLSKCEYSVGFQRMMGKNTLWGFGLHCTGMPIKASADKLSREIKEFGFPPIFPKESQVSNATDCKAKKSKVAAKSGGFKYQWDIMRNMGMSDDEIKSFTDPSHWLEYYPPLCLKHLQRLGVKVDWRRSFITTDANPFYDSFVRWQFSRLKEGNKIMFGKRETIFSPLDNQPCMDHDRQSGEGVGPLEYTLIKMELIRPYPDCLKDFNETICLLAATLRPETMYGQTNCWLNPDIEYVLVRSETHGLVVCVERSARNMAFQDLLKVGGDTTIDVIRRICGSQLIGSAMKSPLCKFEKIYALPMMTIKATKGTAIVTSVPSDSPDDYAALMDVKNKKALRDKYHITNEMVMPFDPVPVLEIPDSEYGNMCAKWFVETKKIQSQNDTEKLREAKEECYKLGFFKGQMIVGKYSGERVQSAKEKIQADLISSNSAIRYFEPENLVMSRSGDECVVARCDQWYLNYHDPTWKANARKCLEQLETFGEEVRRNFEVNLERLHEYACSRSYGLGTRIPWDEQYLVESLSDSTIYMAYYTVAHWLQGGQLNGRGQSNEIGIRPEEMTTVCWEYLLGNSDDAGSIADEMKKKLDVLRKEFLYWYPVDLRVSGKDLIPNHLTYYLYNHCAIWPENPEQFWPKAVRANGHLLLNNDKMSKSTGNFLTIADAIEKYSADGVRLALADSGDSVEDANFVEKTADNALLRLYNLIEWTKSVMVDMGRMRKGPFEIHADLVFNNEMNRLVSETRSSYEAMEYRNVVKLSFYEFGNVRDEYLNVSGGDVHGDLIMRYVTLQCLILSPICPHVCDYLWQNVLKQPRSIHHERWPVTDPVSNELVAEAAYIRTCAAEFNKYATKGKSKSSKPHNEATVWIAQSYPPWQKAVINTMISMAQSSVDGCSLPDNKDLSKLLKEIANVKDRFKKAMDFAEMLRKKSEGRLELLMEMSQPQINERKLIEQYMPYLERTVEVEIGRMAVRWSSECPDGNVRDGCCPLSPKVTFACVNRQSVLIHATNPQLFHSGVTVSVRVEDGDTAAIVARRIASELAIGDAHRITLFQYRSLEESRRIPNIDRIMDGLQLIPRDSQFFVANDHSTTVDGSAPFGNVRYFIDL